MQIRERIDWVRDAYRFQKYPILQAFTIITSIFLAIWMIGLMLYRSMEKTAELKQKQRSKELLVEGAEIFIGNFRYMLTQAPNQETGKPQVKIFELSVSAVVRGTEKDVLQMEDFIENHRDRCRERIEEVTRKATDPQLEDLKLAAVRTQIKQELNGILKTKNQHQDWFKNKPAMIDEIVLSDFRAFKMDRTFE